MKHILQLKIMVIMFISMFFGVAAMGISEGIVFGYFFHLSAEAAEIKFADYSYLFNLLFLAVTSGVFLLLTRKVIRRIEVMNQNVELIAQGELDELEIDGKKDELGNLSRNINDMAQKISQSLEKERTMVCQVAHDLRTPVTSIQGYAGLLEKSHQLSKENVEYVTIIQNKTRDLSKQIEELLEYSVLQFEEKEYTFEKMSLSRLLEQIVIEFIPLLDREGMTFTFTGNQNEMLCNCNPMLMVRLFENLINNSIRYGKKEGKLEIRLEENETNQIYISNYAENVTDAELKHLFDAFYQGKNAKDYQTESKGLGLAIAHQIVMLHQGTIEVKKEDMDKITFYLELPKL